MSALGFPHRRQHSPASVPDGGPPIDAQKLQVYNVALEFDALASGVGAAAGGLRDQLSRASASVILNTAEGAGRRSRRDKARFYGIARGSAMEAAACWDLLFRRRLIQADEYHTGRVLQVRVVQMLSALEKRMLAS
ncbi:MAG: four helix bundle protein [Vicinamibacteria bacterium]